MLVAVISCKRVCALNPALPMQDQSPAKQYRRAELNEREEDDSEDHAKSDKLAHVNISFGKGPQAIFAWRVAPLRSHSRQGELRQRSWLLQEDRGGAD